MTVRIAVHAYDLLLTWHLLDHPLAVLVLMTVEHKVHNPVPRSIYHPHPINEIRGV